MLIHSASQLLTIAGDPQRGGQMGQLGMIPDGAVLIEGEDIVAVGTGTELRTRYPREQALDVSGCVVMPGLVDPHTHLIWAGDRAAEFELRLKGKSYLAILEAGGGIISTVRATRAASIETLLTETRQRLRSMLEHGTTTAEAKTGYGLETESELRLLEALLMLKAEGPLDLAITFLGAHAIAPEFRGDPQGYTDHLCRKMLPTVKQWWQRHATDKPLPFVDVFCEMGAFNLAQTQQILQTAQSLGFPLKVHADEFENLGGTRAAVEFGAISVDHLVAISAEDIACLAKSDTVAVALPCTPFGLAEARYTPARAIIDAGGILALATDLNPGTAWCENMQFAIALACRYMKLTPAEAIVAATINAAAAIGWQNRVGSIEPGKQADLIVLKIPEYRHLGYRFGTNLVKMVIKKGVILKTEPTVMDKAGDDAYS